MLPWTTWGQQVFTSLSSIKSLLPAQSKSLFQRAQDIFSSLISSAKSSALLWGRWCQPDGQVNGNATMLIWTWTSKRHTGFERSHGSFGKFWKTELIFFMLGIWFGHLISWMQHEEENNNNLLSLAFTWSCVSPSLLEVHNPAKHKVCASPITQNVVPLS